ncbi:MFS transporter [Nonomuraea roseola]|uniref:MFS transporter n=1 Tax=Nonomuraea roseola TaxID=46179 RepID=A0ABV5PS83_9ACTN
MSAGLPFRLTRASSFAVACLGLGVLAHLLGGGALSVPAAAGGLGVAFAAAWPLSGRERALGLILPLLGALQAVLHLLFSLSSPIASAPAGHLPLHQGLVPGIGMLVVHGWAVGLTALWLARGEAALWGLLRRLAAGVCRVLVLYLTPSSASAAVVFADEPRQLRPVVLRHAVSRRGPPQVVTAA